MTQFAGAWYLRTASCTAAGTSGGNYMPATCRFVHPSGGAACLRPSSTSSKDDICSCCPIAGRAGREVASRPGAGTAVPPLLPLIAQCLCMTEERPSMCCCRWWSGVAALICHNDLL